ncbi:MAG: cytosine deaminase [Pseudomonadota bacterium]
MGSGFAAVPDEQVYRLANATIPVCLVDECALAGNSDGLARADVLIQAGRVSAVEPPGTEASAVPSLDLDGGMVWPCMVDMHTHLDKGHIWPRQSNPDGTFEGALTAVRADRGENWSRRDLSARMDFALRSAYAHGTKAIRTHLDTYPGQIGITWPLFADIRDRWTGRIALQAACLTAIDQAFDDALMAETVKALKAHGGLLGSVTFMIPEIRDALGRLFKMAGDNGFDLDFHVDETGDPEAHSLRLIAETALETRFSGRITVGHCCSVAKQPVDEAMRTLDLVAEAGLAVVSLPMCNLYLQDRRPGATPRWRGVTLLHEMQARQIPVAIASDNTRDPFYAYGDLDGLEVFREATRILHLDHPFGSWPKSITSTPASIMGLTEAGTIRIGGSADMILFRARTWTELLSRPQSDRTVLRAGKPIDTTLPDYRELDCVLGEPT